MTNYIFPNFQGWSFDKTKTPYWNTNIYEMESGRETRIQKWSYPRYKIQLHYNFLTDNAIKSISLIKGDLEKLQGFFNSVGGPFEDFLLLDDVENFVDKQAFGVGDGCSTTFQLVRSMPNWVEPIRGIVEAPTIYIDGVETAACRFDNYGLIIFDEAPADGSILSWTGTYYFRCRFEDDELELTRSWDGLWEDIEINLVTVK